MTKLTEISVIDQHSLIFQAWRCILGNDRRVTYVSGPITTGPRFVTARENGIAEADKSAVINANIAEIVEAAESLRRDSGRIVIEPGSLLVQAWSQEDYLTLWTALITRYIAEVRFLSGWQMSIGCALEYARAVENGIVCCDLDGTPISKDAAIVLVAGSAAQLANHADERLSLLGTRLAVVVDRLRAL